MTPWGGNSSVLVDSSMLGGSVPAGSGRFVTDTSRLGSVTGATIGRGGLLEPPPTMPRSRLLIQAPPGGGAAQPSATPPTGSRLTLITPSELARRGVKPVTAKAVPKAPKAAPRKKVMASAPQVSAAPQAPKVAAARPTPPPAPKVMAPKPPSQPKTAVAAAPKPPVAPKVMAPKAPSRPSAAGAAPPPPAISAPAPASKPKGIPATSKTTQQASLPGGKEAGPASSISFATNLAGINAAAKAQLDKIAQQLASNDGQRLQLLAYAGEPNLPPSKARRLSLSRALAVRTYLIEKGVRRTRIDVRALGNKLPDGPPSRVDVLITNP